MGFDVYVLKIKNVFFVPMVEEGITFISQKEYQLKKNEDIEFGLSQKIKELHYIESLIEYQQPYLLPDFREGFKSDLVNNFDIMTNGFSKQLFKNDVIKEAIMYTLDMCLKWKEKSGVLQEEIIKGIANQVCDVMDGLLPEFNYEWRQNVLKSVDLTIQLPMTKDIVSQYYRRS